MFLLDWFPDMLIAACNLIVQTPGDCKFFQWIDREATPYERTLLCDLRDAVWKLRRENAEGRQVIEMMQIENAELRHLKEQLQQEKEELMQMLGKTEAAIVEMAGKIKAGNRCWLSRCIVVVIVIAFLFGLMLVNV